MEIHHKILNPLFKSLAMHSGLHISTAALKKLADIYINKLHKRLAVLHVEEGVVIKSSKVLFEMVSSQPTSVISSKHFKGLVDMYCEYEWDSEILVLLQKNMEGYAIDLLKLCDHTRQTLHKKRLRTYMVDYVYQLMCAIQ